MRYRTWIASAIVLLGMGSAALAVPIELELKNSGLIGNESITLFGLDNADGVSKPTSLSFRSNRTTYTIQQSDFFTNLGFTFSGGQVIQGKLEINPFLPILGVGPIDPTQPQKALGKTTISLFPGSFLFDLEFKEFEVVGGNFQSLGTQQRSMDFQIRELPSSPPPIPLPAGAVLLLTGLCGLLAYRRHNRQTA